MTTLSNSQKAALDMSVAAMPLARRRDASQLAWYALDQFAEHDAGRPCNLALAQQRGNLVFLLCPFSLSLVRDGCEPRAALQELADTLGRSPTPWDDWKAAAANLWAATRKLVRYLVGGEA